MTQFSPRNFKICSKKMFGTCFFLRTVYPFHLHHVISRGDKRTEDTVWWRGVVVIVSQKIYQDCVIQGERDKVKKLTLKITEEEKSFAQGGRMCVYAHGEIMTGNWLTAGTHPALGGPTTTSPASLYFSGMEFRLTFSWLHIMSILLQQYMLFIHHP